MMSPLSHSQTEALVADLSKALGKDQVQFDTMTRILYSTDASNYQIEPIGVTFPRNSDDICAIHETAVRHNVPVLPRGGGSSLAGQTVGAAVVMDLTRHMRRVTSVNADECSVTAEAGTILGQLNGQLASLGLMFGPDPASAERAAIGGIIGNNSSGAHSIVYGMTADHVRRLQIVLPNGEKVWTDAGSASLKAIRAKIAGITRANSDEIKKRYPKTWRTCAGYALDKIDPDNVNLNWLLTGSEGTLATIVQAELNLVTRPTVQQKILAIPHFDTVRDSLEATPRILELKPSAIELIDKFMLDKTRAQAEYSRSLTFIEGDPEAVLVVEFVGESAVHLKSQVEALRDLLKRAGHSGAMTVSESAPAQANVWKVRKAGLGLIMSERSDAKPIPFIEDAAVPVENLANYIDDVANIIHKAGTDYAIYAHASAGCLHVRPLINLKTVRGLEQYREIVNGVTETVLKYQGTITGEHGAGLARGGQQAVMFGPQLTNAFREVKQAFDPDNRMNPGKMVDVAPMDDPNILRYSPSYKVIPVNTRFDWSADQGLNGAVEMCNGAGVCRKEGEGTMCPSYQATRDEAHSTRGRANALRAAMSGRLPDGLADESVKGVFDLCLSCKACKSECPSAVDVAMMKAEFLASYHDKHGVDLKTWLFGHIHTVNKMAGLVPGLSNFMLTSGFGKSLMRIAGIPTDRPLPTYARQRFSAWVRRPAQSGAAATLLIDTFTEYNHPEIAQAVVEIVDGLGIPINLRPLPLGSTGRPAISKGLLDAGKRIAHKTLDALDPADGPYLFIEPSEYSAIIDDYPTLVDPSRQSRAAELAANSMMVDTWLADQLIAHGDRLNWDETPRNVILHGHCHQKALWGTGDTLRLLRQIPNATVEEIQSGCCGVAGSFGYEHYEVSQKVAQDRLLPAIEAAPVGTIVTAPGTSCRAQIHDNGHGVVHPVEVVRGALRL
jgi:FAD/FMN-containing dehydrogenase/Fe-S oxidoreductase